LIEKVSPLLAETEWGEKKVKEEREKESRKGSG